MAKATAVRNIRDDHQKAFLKIFNSLCGRFNRWQVWQDFVMVTAIEISNATDKQNAQERTKTYQTIISKYSDAEQNKFAELLAEVIMGMEQNPDQDFLGELYMLCELGNDASGQFFTPYDVCRCMVEISGGSDPAAENAGFFSVSDPACGAGALLIAFANLCRRKNICYHDKVLFVAQDIDLIAGLMCYIEDPNATYQTHEHVTGYSKWNITKDVVVPEDADHVQYFYKVSSGQIDLYKTRDVAAEDAEKAKRDAAREEERMIGESFHNITELMFNLRREFVVELAPTDCKKGISAIARYMACAADDNFDLDLTLIGNILGVELSQEFVDSSGKDWYKILDEDGVYGTMPEKVLLALAYSSMDSSYCGYWSKDWNVERQKYVYSYRENPTLDATYEMLTALGYEISDDEQALRDGTHKIFREYGSDEKKWSDCDYCKAAHPNCDKCCKACDEPCNAVQDCKKNEERTENDE